MSLAVFFENSSFTSAVGYDIKNNMYTYILKCSDGTYYCGWTDNLEKRLNSHNSGKGSKYTRARLPVELVYYEKYDTKQEAMRREWQVKQLRRADKEKLIRGEF